MAVFESQIATRIRGSAGDITFCQNHNAQIVMRAKINNPANPNTAAQQDVRNGFATASTAWESATDAQRADWTEYAKTIRTRKSFATSEFTGRTAFLASIGFANFIKNKHGQPAVIGSDAPVLPGYLQQGFIEIMDYVTPVTTGFRFRFINNDTERVFMLTSYSRPQNLARNKWDGPFSYGTRRLRVLNGGASIIVVIPAGGSYAGKVAFHQFRVLSFTEPFRLSALQIVRIPATTNP